MVHAQLNKKSVYLYLFVYCVLIGFAIPFSQGLKNAPLLFHLWAPAVELQTQPSPPLAKQAAQPNTHGYPRAVRLLPASQPAQAVAASQTLSVAQWVNVPGTFTLPVIQQPPDNPVFVSAENNRVTQFEIAYQNGITALLAHNYLAGTQFYNLRIGQVVSIDYVDKSVKHYRITRIDRYQKVDPSKIQSDLIDLSTHQTLSSTQVFNRYYIGDHRVIFQTCLEGNGQLNWGLYFVVATPVNGKGTPPV